MFTGVLQEYRCYANNKLLCKAGGVVQVEIMNPTNRVLNYCGPARKSQDEGLRGREFEQLSVDLNCRKCKRLLGRALGIDGVVEIKCRACSEISLFDIEKMQELRNSSLPTVVKDRLRKQRMDACSVTL